MNMNNNVEVFKDMLHDCNFMEINNYESFLRSAYSHKEKYMLTEYTVDDLKNMNVTTFKLRNYNLGFALKPDDMGFDIILMHNASKLEGLGYMKYVIELAKSYGGNHVDYYETDKLKHMWTSAGFKEYERYKFDPQYTHDNFNCEKYGTPDVVYAKL